ncbi:MAG: hypothetical protein MI923_21485 [Phycisphaerales bacterium]|nr:hypothetical protein [Phycisphaerales bacterium]
MALKQFDKTLEKVADDEPIFVLRARDVIAPMAVEHWAEMAAKLQVNPQKVLEAYQCAESMRNWKERRLPD